jgi:hypothetical protein
MKSRQFEMFLARPPISALGYSAVDQRARALREGDLLSHGGRGPRAPDITIGDAANMLLALAAPMAADAPATVADLRAMVEKDGAFLGDGSTFGNAIELIIARGVTERRVQQVRIARPFRSATIILEDGAEVRYGPAAQPATGFGTLLYDELVFRGAGLDEIHLRLCRPTEGGWAAEGNE